MESSGRWPAHGRVPDPRSLIARASRRRHSGLPYPGADIKILDDCHNVAPEALLTNFKEAVRAWQGKDEPIDDQSIVLVLCR